MVAAHRPVTTGQIVKARPACHRSGTACPDMKIKGGI